MLTAPIQPGSPVSSASRPAAWEVWWRWTLGTTIGELVGFAVPATVMAWGTVGEWSDAVETVASVLVGAVEGGILGLAQWLALHRVFPMLSWRAWVGATAAGAMVAYLLAMFAVALGLSSQLPGWLLAPIALVLGVGFLLSIGLPQWLVLRRHLPCATWWISANALAWPLGVAMPFATLGLVPDGAPFWAWVAAGVLGGVLMGLVVGALTGLTLVWLWRRSDDTAQG